MRPQNSLVELRGDDVNHEARNRIFYVIRTSEQIRQSRIPSILGTWAGPVKDSLLMVSERSVDKPKIYAAKECASDHWEGLICKTGHAFALAAKMMDHHDWVMFLDDDVYVNTSNLEKELQKHNASQLVALGIPGCGTPHCQDKGGGFCGGGGYAISKLALQAFVDKLEPSQFAAEMLHFRQTVWPEASPADDVISTCLMKERGIKVEQLRGLYGWRLEKQGEQPPEKNMSNEYKFAIHEDSTPPLTFHAIKPAEMYLLQEEFKRSNIIQRVSLLQSGQAENSRYDIQREEFIKKRKAMLA